MNGTSSGPTTCLYLDASALAKRYIPEAGSATMDAVFSVASSTQLMAHVLAVGEVFSVLVRRRNAGILSGRGFQHAERTFRTELVNAVAVRLEPVSAELLWRSLTFIPTYSINATDAMVLQSALDAASRFAPTAGRVVLVSSDVRLLRAASAERLAVFSPETEGPDAVAALLQASTP